MSNIEWFLLLFLVVAILYSSVGHGGASGYLALMALWELNVGVMKHTALMVNFFVSGIAFVQFYNAGYFRKNLFIPFIITSMPAAFLGGMIPVNAILYKKILGILLLFGVLRMFLKDDNNELSRKKMPFIYGAIAGLIIGFFSGLIGIGGGIILSPLILIMRWGTMKETAAVSALFICVNSISGFLGSMSQGPGIRHETLILAALGVGGGFLGAYLGSNTMNKILMRIIMTLVLMIASLKLIFV